MLTVAMAKMAQQASGGAVGGKMAMMKAMAGPAVLIINPMTKWAADAFFIAVALYVCSLAAVVLSREKWTVWLLATGLAANLISLGLRLASQWPMQAPYQGPFWLSACLAALILFFMVFGRPRLAKTLVPALVALGALALFFPGDSYVPYPRSDSITAHLSLLFISASKALFIASGAEAFNYLSRKNGYVNGSDGPSLFGNLLVWGFVLYTLGLFLAELWAYLAWSSPVAWEDFSMVSTMALWFFYSCFLHLHLLGRWDPQRRAWFSLSGLPILFYFTYLPELGPLALPGILR